MAGSRCGGGSGRFGMTLIEVMLAISIFAASLVWAMQAIFGAVATNRVLMAGITANSSLRAQIEELYGVAMDNVERFGDFAQGVIFYYGTQVADPNSSATADTLPIGPNGTRISRISLDSSGILTYRFVIPEPGEMKRALVDTNHDGLALEQGELIPYRRGIGEMVLYLDESLMPADPTNPGSSSVSPLWQTLGDNNSSGDNMRVTPVNGPFTKGDLRNPDSLGFPRVFADIRVTYFSDDRHTKEIFTDTRRVLINGALENLFILDGSATDGSN